MLTCCVLAVIGGLLLMESSLARVIQSEEKFETGHLNFLDSSTGSSQRLKRRDVESSHTNRRRFQLQVTSSDVSLDMDLSSGSVWVSDSKTLVRHGDQTVQISPTLSSECFLSGPLTSGEGYASFSFCNGVNGIIQTPKETYIVSDFNQDPSHATNSSDADGNLPSLRIEIMDPAATLGDEPINLDDTILPLNSDGNDHADSNDDVQTTAPPTTTKSPKALPKATIEVGIYLNSDVREVLGRWGMSSPLKLVEWIINRWNIIRAVFADKEKVGTEIDIKVKHLEMWWQNPPYYASREANQTINSHLATFCDYTPDDKMDVRILYTWEKKFRTVGLAVVGGVCRPKKNCAIVIPQQQSVQRDMHEFGHCLGLLHDPKLQNCTMPNGFMGWHNTTEFKDCYRPALLDTLSWRSSRCVFEDSGVQSQVSVYKDDKLTSADKTVSDLLNK